MYNYGRKKMNKITKKKKFIALLISVVLLTSMLMPSMVFAVTCPIVNCGASVSAYAQGVGEYARGTHTVNKVLGVFGGETCTWVEYHKYYANKCAKGHIVGAWSDFYQKTHNVDHN
jgi:hypothetical protein